MVGPPLLQYCTCDGGGGGGGEAARQLLVSPLVNFELSADPRHESRFIARMHEYNTHYLQK